MSIYFKFEGNKMKKLCFLIAFTLFAVSAEAKNLYVNGATGNDTVTYTNNSQANPWRTIGRASWGSTNRSSPNPSEAAQAGDTVYITAGTYNASDGSGQRYIPAWNPVNEGTAGNYITFQGVGTVTLQSTNNTGPVIGSNNRDYIKWDNFYIDEANVNTTRDSGPVVAWGASGDRVQYVEFSNIEIKGKAVAWAGTNHSAIRFVNASNSTVRNCKIYGNTNSAGVPYNSPAIQFYWADNILIENNEIFNNGAGIQIKHQNEGPITVRYNLIYDNLHSGVIIMGTIGEEAVMGTVYQNVLRDNGFAGISWWGYPTGPDNFRVVNNTIDSNVNGFFFDNCGTFDNNLTQNNIATNSSNYALKSSSCSFDNTDILHKHNMYNTYGTFVEMNWTDYTFTTWKSTFTQDSANPASQNVNPQYFNESANDFRLSPSSPARNAGIEILDLDNDGSTTDFINLGAYITGNEQIGIRPLQPPVVPMPPSSVRAE